MLGVSVWELPWDFKDGNLVCKKLVGHALSVPDREERHLLSEDLGSGEPVSRASARKKAKSEVSTFIGLRRVNFQSRKYLYFR